MNSKNGKKVRFFPYPPHGHCSRNAITVASKTNPYATALATAGDAQGTAARAGSYRKNSLTQVRFLVDTGYATDGKLLCGDHENPRVFHNLICLGLTALLGIPDDIAPNEEEAHRNITGIKKGNYFAATPNPLQDCENYFTNVWPPN